MKLTHEPKTIQGKLYKRTCQAWMLHPGCQLAVGDVAPMSDVLAGKLTVVMFAKGPLMITRYFERSRTQFLFDVYGTQ
jgi:hypothetical protein